MTPEQSQMLHQQLAGIAKQLNAIQWLLYGVAALLAIVAAPF